MHFWQYYRLAVLLHGTSVHIFSAYFLSNLFDTEAWMSWELDSFFFSLWESIAEAE